MKLLAHCQFLVGAKEIGPLGTVSLETFSFYHFLSFFAQFIYQESKLLASLMYWYICYLSGWSWVDSKFTVHVDLPKRPIN